MEFDDVVMKRRAVRRFEEGGVDREVIERIARLAQRTPSAGFSQGQRLVVVTDPARRREVARICGEEEYEPRLRAVDQRVRRPVHPVRQRGDLPPPLPGAGQDRRRRHRDRRGRSPTGGSTSARRCRTSCWPRSNEGLGCGFVGTDDLDALRDALGIPDGVRADRGHAGRAARSRTCGHPASSEAGCRSSSSPAGSAGADDPQGVGSLSMNWTVPRTACSSASVAPSPSHWSRYRSFPTCTSQTVSVSPGVMNQ